MEVQNLSGAFWCDSAQYPQWCQIPISAFDRAHLCQDKMLEFRTSLDYSGQGKFHLRYTGGCRFRMRINDQFVEDGPVEIGGDYGKTDAPDWWFFDEIEISRFLQPGKNVLVFEMFPAGMCQMDYSLGYGWLFCAVKQTGQWMPIPAPEWEFRVNAQYQNQAFQDYSVAECISWSACCKSIQVPIVAQSLDLPHLTLIAQHDYRILFPFGHTPNIRVRGRKLYAMPGNTVTFFLEFPEERCGFFELQWHCDRGVTLHLDFEEQYGVPGMTATIRTSSAAGSWQSVKLYPFRYVQITLEASDFWMRQDAGKCVFSFGMLERHFPVAHYRSLSENTPEVMRKIDEICLRNVLMCMQRMHLDSPVHQEGLGCTGDYRIEARAEYAAYGESRLAKADLIRTALLLRQQKKMFHTSYALCYVLMLQEYFQFTGDRALLEYCYDTLHIVYRQFHDYTGETGLLSNAENYLFIDWVNDGAYTYHHPPASRGTGALTALWYGALQAMTSIAAVLHREEDAQIFAAEAKNVRQAFNRELWDAELACYLDGIPGLNRRANTLWLPPDDGESSATSLTSIMALAYGLPDKEQNPEQLIAKIIAEKLPLRPGVYYMFYLFEAVVRYQLWAKYGKKLILEWRSFLPTGLRESWVTGDYSHGWGASPSIFMREIQDQINTGKSKRSSSRNSGR